MNLKVARLKRKCYHIQFLVAIFFLLNVSYLNAQNTSVAWDSLTWTYDITASGFISDDGNQRVLFNNLGVFTVGNSAWSDRVVMNYQVGKVRREIKENDFFTYNIFRLNPTDKYFPLAIGGFELSNTRAIDFRWFSGIGGGIHLIDKENFKLEFTTTIIHQRTNYDLTFDDRINGITDDTENSWRITPRLFGLVQLSKGPRFEYECWIQPSLEKFDDYHAYGNFALLIPVIEKLFVRLGWIMTYESIVTTSSPKFDSIINIGFTFKNGI
ncbi:DUF481 domain-containing protein [uncultured Aquimarina sp.]|uniref:DUF481 domain-containing protein n=1 Tax=uncultured Aquimarina sp. TaxID=575652 RepID=UPI002613420F|nr:DUF481 domain-containing protein [uncultured Aquimarina sp.]